jgi:hypothetical protein
MQSARPTRSKKGIGFAHEFSYLICWHSRTTAVRKTEKEGSETLRDVLKLADARMLCLFA